MTTKKENTNDLLRQILKENKRQTKYIKTWMTQDEDYHEKTLKKLKK